MRLTTVCKANSFNLPEGQTIKGQIIVIDDKIPPMMDLSESDEFHEDQAGMINHALQAVLPQGTYDRLGIKFMQHKISLYQGRTGT